MRIDFAVTCDYAIVDRFGKLSVLGIFQHIWVGQFPVVHPRLHLVMRLKGRRTEVGEHRVRIRLYNEEREEVVRGDGAVNFSEPPAGVTEIEAGCVLVFDVPFAKPGRYVFAITVDDDVMAEVPITVAQGPPPPGRPPGAAGGP